MKEIKLSKNKVALVDDEDFDRVNAFRWYASQESRNGKKWYAIRRVTVEVEDFPGIKYNRRVKIRMHRFIMGLGSEIIEPTGLVVDHGPGGTLDNRKENLEIVTQKVNMERAPNWKRRSSGKDSLKDLGI